MATWKNRRRAFTLLELLIVVAIIAILAALAVPNYVLALHRAKVSRARSDMRAIQTAVELYRVDQNNYPVDVMGFVAFTLTRSLTTPIAYMTDVSQLRDPFNEIEAVGEAWWMGNYRFVNIDGRMRGMKALDSSRNPNDWLGITPHQFRVAQNLHGNYMIASHKINYKDNFRRDENGAIKAYSKWHEFYRKPDGGDPKFMESGELVLSQRHAFIKADVDNNLIEEDDD